MSDVVPLSSVATITSGKRPHAVLKEATSGLNVPVIGGGGPSGYTSDALFSGDALITGRVGTLGKLFAPSGPCWPSDNALVIRPKSAQTDFQFLRYAVQARIGDAVGMNRGAANPLITQTDLGGLLIFHPDLAAQRAGARVLGALDDKIDLNRRMNETLETMARTLFRDWFVDFGPTRAKMEGRAPYLALDLWSLFPDRLDEEGKPEEWGVGHIRDCCSAVFNGGTPKRDHAEYWDNGTVPWLTSGEVRQPFLIDTENYISFAGLRNSSAKVINPQSTVVALYGATAGYVAFVASEMTANQAVCALAPKAGYRYYNFLLLSSSLETLAGMARGSAQQNLSKALVEDFPVITAPPEVMVRFDMITAPLFTRIVDNMTECRTLGALRDLLLTKLMAGEIRVRDAEKVLEAAL